MTHATNTQPAQRNPAMPAVCPWQGGSATAPLLEPASVLVIPLHKRLITRYSTNADGLRELRLYYGDREILFDDPDLFAFAEMLGQQSRFVAGTACTWGTGYVWPRVRELLEQLLDENILHHAKDGDTSGRSAAHGSLPSPLPPAAITAPRTWFECEAISRELLGRPLDIGYLELMVPVYRIAHMALDREGRQVGEGNVFPLQLRLDVATDWRTCHYPGSRFQHPQPMNVTALKSMIRHWKPTMLVLQQLRGAYLERFPRARQGWTVGDLQRLSALVLSVPGYLLMRARQRVGNGDLHPVFSSLYRVTDGVRMTMHRMLLTSVNEPSLPPDAPMTAGEIYAYAESNNVFVAEDGVCAGPKAMIEEFLRVLVDGQPIRDADTVTLDPDVRLALDDLAPALDYGVLGLQAYAVVVSRWPAMARAYEKLLARTASWPPDALPAWRERLQRNVAFLRTATRQHDETRRAIHERMHADLYAQCAGAPGGCATPPTLAAYLAPASAPTHDDTERQCVAMLRERCPGTTADTDMADIAAVLVDYLRTEQAIVRAAAVIQRRINDVLGRNQPVRPLTAADIALHHALVGLNYPAHELQSLGGRLPNLIDELEADLGLRVVVDGDAIEIFDDANGLRAHE